MSFITTANAKTEFTTYRGNLGGAGDTEFLQWMNFLQEFAYPKLYATNPDDYLSNRYIKTIADTEGYTAPTDLETLQVGGLYTTKSGDTYQALNFDAQTAAFTVGETLTGGTSGATGTIYAQTDYGTTGTLILTSVSGTYSDNETITSAAGSATANGTAIAFIHSDTKLDETRFGSSALGYWIDETYVNFTPIPNASEVYVLRYIPTLTTLTSTSTSTIFTTKYKEFVTYAMEVYWSMWRQNQNNEFLSGQRYAQALMDYLHTVKKTPRVMRLQNRSWEYYNDTDVNHVRRTTSP